MRDDEDHEQLGDELEAGVDRLEQRSEELEDEIDSARGDWEAKRRDGGVVGGPPPREDG